MRKFRWHSSSLLLFSFLVSCFEFAFLFVYIGSLSTNDTLCDKPEEKKQSTHTLAEYKFILRFELCSFVYFVVEPKYYPLQSIIDTYIKA